MMGGAAIQFRGDEMHRCSRFLVASVQRALVSVQAGVLG